MFILIPIAIIFISVYLFFVKSSIKIAIFVCDYFMILYFSTILFHHYIATKISTGIGVFVWDFLLIIAIIFLYTFILKLIHNISIKASYVINYIISVIGISFAFKLISIFLGMFDGEIRMAGGIILVNNYYVNKAIYYILYLVLAIPVCKYRVNILKGSNADDMDQTMMEQ